MASLLPRFSSSPPLPSFLPSLPSLLPPSFLPSLTSLLPPSLPYKILLSIREDYMAQLSQKKKIEVQATMDKHVQKLIWDCDLDEFIEDMNLFLPQRDELGYQIFMEKMGDTEQVPLLQEKIWVVVTCRRPPWEEAGGQGEKEGEEDDEEGGEVVWNRGNTAAMGEVKFWKDFFESADVKACPFSLPPPAFPLLILIRIPFPISLKPCFFPASRS
jgi:hypothetical protein